MNQLKSNLVAIFEENKKYTGALEAADKYIEENSDEVVAKKFIEFFKKLKQQK